MRLNRREQREQRGTDKAESGLGVGALSSPKTVMAQDAWHGVQSPSPTSVSSCSSSNGYRSGGGLRRKRRANKPRDRRKIPITTPPVRRIFRENSRRAEAG